MSGNAASVSANGVFKRKQGAGGRERESARVGDEEQMQRAFERESCQRASSSWDIQDIAEGTLQLQVYFLVSLVFFS